MGTRSFVNCPEPGLNSQCDRQPLAAAEQRRDELGPEALGRRDGVSREELCAAGGPAPVQVTW